MRIVVSNVTLVDNGLGIMPLIYAPPSLSHAFADKPVHVQVRIQNILLFISHPFIIDLRTIFLFVPECFDCWKQSQLQLLRNFVQQ